LRDARENAKEENRWPLFRGRLQKETKMSRRRSNTKRKRKGAGQMEV
jgi:hypothetical protein